MIFKNLPFNEKILVLKLIVVLPIHLLHTVIECSGNILYRNTKQCFYSYERSYIRVSIIPMKQYPQWGTSVILRSASGNYDLVT